MKKGTSEKKRNIEKSLYQKMLNREFTVYNKNKSVFSFFSYSYC